MQCVIHGLTHSYLLKELLLKGNGISPKSFEEIAVVPFFQKSEFLSNTNVHYILLFVLRDKEMSLI